MKYSFKKENTMTALCVICELLIAALFIVFVIRTIKGNQKTYDINQESAKESLMIPDVMHTNNDLDYWSTLDETHPEKVYERVINTPEAESVKTDDEWHFFLLYSNEGFRLLCLAAFLLLAIIALCTWKSIRKPNNRDIYKYMDALGESTHAIGENVSFLMENALRKEDLAKRNLWTDEALRKKFGYEGTERSEEFIKWAYMRIWHSNDFDNEQIRQKVTYSLQDGYITTLYQYALWVYDYLGFNVDFLDIEKAIESLETIRKQSFEEMACPKEEKLQAAAIKKSKMFSDKLEDAPFKDYLEAVEPDAEMESSND